MRAWTLLLGGLLVWAADFFLLYAIASIWLTSLLSRLLTGLVTLPAVAADLWLLQLAWKRRKQSEDKFERWLLLLATFGAALSLVAVIWQSFPALFI